MIMETESRNFMMRMGEDISCFICVPLSMVREMGYIESQTRNSERTDMIIDYRGGNTD